MGKLIEELTLIIREQVNIKIFHAVITGIMICPNEMGRCWNFDPLLFDEFAYICSVCHGREYAGVDISWPTRTGTTIISGKMWVI
ncbi:MAG: hypothetical protein BWZ03_00594 [bacterium ADurb.BinA186]|nr:MAG: hypothetical protein BWZ03_00594 [bacterium ADurb.BinA186]